jgi:hypothetical protein
MPDLLSNSDEFQRFAWHFAVFRAGFRKNAELEKLHKYLCDKALGLHGVDFEFTGSALAKSLPSGISDKLALLGTSPIDGG